MKRFVVLVCVLSVLLMVPKPVHAAETDCWVEVSDFWGMTCYLIDLEATPQGETLQVAVAVVHGMDASADPLVYLEGGPGGSSIAQAPRLTEIFGTVLMDRDLVLIDVRGTGFSQPALTCPAYVDAMRSESPDALTEALQVCQAEWGIPMTAFTTESIAEDVATIIPMLGYERAHLFGISYGTWVAQTVMVNHPEVVSSVVLDSTVHPTADFYTEGQASVDAAFENLFTTCRKRIFCRLAYPNLENTYLDLVSNEGVQVSAAITNGLYSARGRSYLPALIFDTTEGNIDQEAQTDVFLEIANSFSYGVHYAVICQDIYPHKSVPKDTWTYGYTVIYDYDLHQTVCDGLGLPVSPQPVSPESDIPTLILAGELDPVTPVRWAEETTTGLNQARLYTFPTAGHGVIGTGECPLYIIRGFLNSPTTEPQSGCIGRMSLPFFVIRPHASRIPTIVLVISISIGTFIFTWGLLKQSQGFRGAWVGSLKLLGWPLLLGVPALVLLGILDLEGSTLLQREALVTTLIPAVSGVLASFAFNPESEPEITLALPRPTGWLLIERLVVILVSQGILAIIVSLIFTNGITLEWVVPTLFLVGAAAAITLITRRSLFGVALILVLWAALLYTREILIPFLPFLWPVNIFMLPDSFAEEFFTLNRIFVSVMGLGMIALAARQFDKEERFLA